MALRRPIKRLVLRLILLAFACRNAAAVNSVLDIDGVYPYLINKTDGRYIEPRDYMDFDNIYTPNETYKQQVTASSRNYYLFKAFDFANYFQSDYWHYSDDEDLRLSAQPVANQDRCARHLHWLDTHLNKTNVLFAPGQQHVNLMSLVDAFGHPEASTFYGHMYWLGDFNQCNRVNIDLDKFELEECRRTGENCSRLEKNSTHTPDPDRILKTRYCMGKAHDIDWPTNDDYVPRISYKIGLCLPESCETLSFEQHAAQIERLMRVNMPEYMRTRMNLHEIYCLPDSRSPIRAFGLASRVFLSICIAWLLIQAASTWLFSCQKRNQRDIQIMSKQVNQEALKMIQASGQSAGKQLGCSGVSNKLINIDSINLHRAYPGMDNNHLAANIDRQSMQPLTKASKTLSTDDGRIGATSISSSSSSRISTWINESSAWNRVLQCLSISENISELLGKRAVQPDASKRMRVNLNALDSIKCLCCLMVIFGHIAFVHMQHMTNILYTIEQSHGFVPRLLMAFFNFVDTFFIMSGMLTAYSVFKRFNKETFAKPTIWFLMALFRIIRLSSVFVFVFWFSKTLTVHLSDGPIWDYGTDKNSNKGLCINDHWWKSILYVGNYGTMQPLCVLPAWSIIVDSQYSLIMAPVLYLLLKHKRLGYTTLIGSIVATTFAMSHQLATQTAVKTSDMAKVRLHVYPLISRFAAEFYNTATNRLGPVAIGILGGHLLHLYNSGRIERWPWFMRGISFKFVLLMHLLIFLMPTLGLYTDHPLSTHDTDVTIFVICNATVKPLWSLFNTIFMLRLVTDLRKSSAFAKFMALNLWRPLGKLCFASYLIHYEIIMIQMKSRHDGYPEPSWMNMVREFCLAFMISTILSFFIYILFEAPINNLALLMVVAKKPVALASKESEPRRVTGDVTLPAQDKMSILVPPTNGNGRSFEVRYRLSDAGVTAVEQGTAASRLDKTSNGCDVNNSGVGGKFDTMTSL